MNNKTAYLVDFDGTVTFRDISSDLPAYFDQKRFDEIQNNYRRRGIPIRTWLKKNAELLPADLELLLRLALSWAELRPGFAEFLDAAKDSDAPVVIASDGFGFYIEPVLKRHGLLERISAIYCNRTLINNAAVELSTPHSHPGCRVCGNCKAAHVVRLRQQGYAISYIGDGSNDRFGASWADLVFARDELLGASREHGFNYRQWDTFYDILDAEAPVFANRPGKDLCDPLGSGVYE